MEMLLEHLGFTAEFNPDLYQWNVKNRCGENIAVIEYDHYRDNTLCSGVLITYRTELKHEDKVSIGALADKISKCGYVEINVLIEKLVAILSDNTCRFEYQLNATHHKNIEKAIKFANNVACGILCELGLISSLEASLNLPQSIEPSSDDDITKQVFDLRDFKCLLYNEKLIVPYLIKDKNLLF